MNSAARHNFVKTHRTLRLTDGWVADKRWSVADLADMIHTALPAPGKRCPYKKATAASGQRNKVSAREQTCGHCMPDLSRRRRILTAYLSEYLTKT